MTEQYPSDDELAALSGTTGSAGEVYPSQNANPWATAEYKFKDQVGRALVPLTALQVYKDGDLTFGVRAGQFVNVNATVSYVASTDNALTNNATNYIYIVRDGTLTVSTSSFPVPGVTPHLPLAEIVTAAGVYDVTDITDRRTRSMFKIVGIQEWSEFAVFLFDAKAGVANQPTFTSWLDNGAGSEGLAAWFFADQAVQGNEEFLFFSTELPHDYKEGSDIAVHVHWAAEANGGAGEVVSWGLEYAIVNRGAVVGNTTIIGGNAHVPADASLVANTNYQTALGTIDGTGLEISACLVGRFFRDSSGTLRTDDYTDDGIAIAVGFHYEIDSNGSQDKNNKL